MLEGSAWFWFAMAGTVLVALAVAASRWPVALRPADPDRELVHLVDRAAVDDLRDRLIAGPVPVRAWCEVSLARGPVLLIDHGAGRLRMRLYGGSSLPEGATVGSTPRRLPSGPVPLVRIDDLGDRGWLVVLEPPEGRIRYHGWQIEQVRADRGATARPA